MTKKIKLCHVDIDYIADRILLDLGGFVDLEGNIDKSSKLNLISIIENAIYESKRK